MCDQEHLLLLQVCRLLSDAATALHPQESAAPTQHGAGNANQARQLQTPEQRQAALKARLVKKFSAKSAVYENCKMLSQDGELLCFCDMRKLTWYEVRSAGLPYSTCMATRRP